MMEKNGKKRKETNNTDTHTEKMLMVISGQNGNDNKFLCVPIFIQSNTHNKQTGFCCRMLF